MKKILALVISLAMLCTALAALAEETAGAEGMQASKITGDIRDGSYVLTVQTDPEDKGDWRADEMAQDDTVVKLASSGTENGVFTAVYAPAGDGEVSVSLRHFNEHNTCDEMHSFTLLVKDGRVQEETGGSFTASPAEDDLDTFFSGEWLEKDTQFTVLDVTKKIEDGWDVEITSPVSRGAWVIKATAYYDCDYDAFVYADGVKYNLLPEGGVSEEKANEGMWGTLKLNGTEESLWLEWYDMEETGDAIVFFETAPGLPAYAYTGTDPVEGAVADMLANSEEAQNYKTEQGYVTIPCPVIHKIETVDDTHAKVYGSFWILNYVKRGECLNCISGGEYAGIITLEKEGEGWKAAGMETVGDGEDYAEDIRKFAGGDKELEDKYFAAADLKLSEEIRTRFIRDYAEANSLPVTCYQDYGWDPVMLK